MDHGNVEQISCKNLLHQFIPLLPSGLSAGSLGELGQSQNHIFFIFFYIFSAPGPIPEPSPGLEVQFPVKNAGFGCVCVELSHFSSFLTCLESCEPLFDDLGFLFFDFETWEGFSVWIGKGSLSWIKFGLGGFPLWKS